LKPGVPRKKRQSYRKRYGEVDLIAEESRPDGAVELVFLEVRLRSGNGWVNGIESVVSSKRRRIERTARSFLCGYRGRASSIRFDVLAYDGKSWTHCRAAW
jgi:Holliday junction resolvase-like predicted endonuclease